MDNNDIKEFLQDNKCFGCINEMKNILAKLINKLVTISISDSERGVINNASIIEVGEAIVKVKTERNTLIVLSINEIVGIKSSILNTMDILKQSSDSLDKGFCAIAKEYREYFNYNIGRRILMQTKGSGEFRYINNKPITSVGNGFVFIDNNMIISTCKINLIEEVYKKVY
jgi:hypothetical protein